jgi:hypothetical protein
MKPLAFLKCDAGSLFKQAVSPADPMPALAREKLAALTHRIQLIIRQKPREMTRLLAFYQNFLSLKEELERYFTREEACCSGFHQTGTGFKPAATFMLLPSPTMLLQRILNGLKEELAGFGVLLSQMQKQQKVQQGFFLALYLFMNELDSFTRLLEAYRNQLPAVLLSLPLPS